jgi:HEAT repeat protein
VLGQIGSRKATKPLIAWLNQQSDCDIMEEAVRALGLARDPEAVSFLLELLSSGVSIQDENYRLKVFAIIALGEIADKRATDGSSSTTPWLPI